MPELLIESDEWHFGHVPLNRRLNYRKELRRLRVDPLEQFLRQVRGGEKPIFGLRDDLDAYEQAYQFYYLSLSRFLPASSLAWRCRDRKWWPRKRGGGFKSLNHRELGKKYVEALPFILYDLWNCLFHARILMDCTIRLSRLFLKPGPSFTSFSDHKKFLQKRLAAITDHREYALFIAEKTDWFDIPIKLVRDKFFVHAGPRHERFLTFPGAPRGFEIGLTIMLPTKPQDKQWAKEIKHITVSIPRLMDDIDTFLHWFNDYGVAARRTISEITPEADAVNCPP